MEDRISLPEFREWLVYFDMQSRNREKWEYYLADIIYKLHNANFKPPYKHPKEALLEFSTEPVDPKEKIKSMSMRLKAWAAMQNNIIAKKKKKQNGR